MTPFLSTSGETKAFVRISSLLGPQELVMRIRFLSLFFISALLSPLCVLAGAAARLPNFVVILMDDMGWRDVEPERRP